MSDFRSAIIQGENTILLNAVCRIERSKDFAINRLKLNIKNLCSRWKVFSIFFFKNTSKDWAIFFLKHSYRDLILIPRSYQPHALSTGNISLVQWDFLEHLDRTIKQDKIFVDWREAKKLSWVGGGETEQVIKLWRDFCTSLCFPNHSL